MANLIAQSDGVTVTEYGNTAGIANQLKDKAAWLPKITYHLVHAIPGRVRFRVPGLTKNPEYATRLQALIESDPRVTQVRVKSAAASIVICYQANLFSDTEMHRYLGHLIQNAGMGNGEKLTESQPTNEPTSEGNWSELKRPLLATALALLGNVLPIPKPIIAGSVAAAGLPVARRAMESLVGEHRLNIDCLDLMAIALCSAQGNWLTPALVMTLHEIGDMIRDRTARSSHLQTLDLLDSIGHCAWVERDGQKQQVSVADVQHGDTVIVYPGEQIPVDGVVLQGNAVVDQQKLTGESMPVVREVGQSVYASTLVRSGEIYIKTERVGVETRAGASIQMVQQAPVHDTRMENYAATLADKAVVPAFILAGAILALSRNPARAASILTLDFVTGMRVSIPTTFLAALTHATRHGVLIRSGRALEQLAKVDTIVFDKTGTLTQGNLAVVAVETVAGRISAERVLELAAAAEQRLTHPVAEAVMRYAEEQGIRILPRGEWHYDVGLGVRAEIDGETVLVGSDRFLQEAGISLDCFYDQHPCVHGECDFSHTCPISADSSLIYIASNGQFQGIIQYTDPLRPESQSAIAQLQLEYGMEVHLLTGDNQTKAIAVAKELGIPRSEVHAEAFPEQKAEVIRQLHEAGKTVAFTGDGLNDSVALAYADVSISFGNGSEVARETADVVLMNNDLGSLLEAIAIAKQTLQIIQQNTTLAVTPNLAALSLASTVGLHPLAATVVHNGSAIAAGLNGLRPLMHRHPSQ